MDSVKCKKCEHHDNEKSADTWSGPLGMFTRCWCAVHKKYERLIDNDCADFEEDHDN